MVEREQKTKEADARSPTLNTSCSTSKHVYGNLVYSELASQARMLVDEGKQGCNDYNVCCKGDDFLVISEISNEIFLFFFLSAFLSHLDTSFYSFLFAVFFCRLTKFPFFTIIPHDLLILKKHLFFLSDSQRFLSISRTFF